MNYIAVITRAPTTTGGRVYVAFHPELPYCTAQGMTLEEARRNLDEVRADYMEHCREFNLPIPEPFAPGTPLWVDLNHMTGGRL